MGNKIRIYVGYDESQEIAYDVCNFSIKKNSRPNTITVKKINCNTVNGYNREHDPLASTQFTYARFYIPFIEKYEGYSVFCDSDFLFLKDATELTRLFDPQYAVQVVKHDYNPTNSVKMNNKIQTVYPRKNWSSLILWNNGHPKNKKLNLDLLNTSTGSFLHQFKWLDDNDIGEIPYDWNWLVGWYKETEEKKPKALHFTEGGPWLKNADNPYDDLWLSYKERFILNKEKTP